MLVTDNDLRIFTFAYNFLQIFFMTRSFMSRENDVIVYLIKKTLNGQLYVV